MPPRKALQNPFRPGAGHMPPYLAGRRHESDEFARLLRQDIVLANLVLTGLRGVGKTVLLETFKPLAHERGWWWVGADLSEAVSVSEERFAVRLLTDLAIRTSAMVLERRVPTPHLSRTKQVSYRLDYAFLRSIYDDSPGLIADKLKAVLEFTWECLKSQPQVKGVAFAYDEAQNFSDNAPNAEYPLSLMLDVFQSLQKKGVPFMLVLTGLPTLYPKLVDARTYSERMFRVLFLDHLDEAETRDAILKPIQDARCPLALSADEIRQIYQLSGGYPYFIQFICRELYDVALERLADRKRPSPSFDEIVRKLDNDFFAGRWARVTDRQRDLLTVIARLDNGDHEFTVQEIVRKSKTLLARGFSTSHVSQLLQTLSEAGLIYKNRHGRYSFAVPLFGKFILRQGD